MEENTTKLSEKEIARAVSNDPALSEVSFELGNRTFKIVDLDYDANLAFMSKLKPLMQAMFSAMAGSGGVPSLEGLDLTSLLQYCGNELPDMVRIVCSQTDPNITVEEVKKLGKSPFKLAFIVLKQIEQNNLVQDFADFFVSIVPLIRTAMAGQRTR